MTNRVLDRSIWRRRWATVLAAVSVGAAATITGPLVGAGTASADPVVESGDVLARVSSPDGSHITRVEWLDDVTYAGGKVLAIWVYSAAMGKEVPLNIQRPADASAPRPVLYLLNGAGGGTDGATWRANTDVTLWLSDKNVNVVTPIGGAFSYYTDWKSPDPELGVNKWKTFLTEEIPPIIDAALGTSGKNAIAGISTSGTSVLALPIAKPGLYVSAAAYSGCAQTADPFGQLAVRLSIETWGRGSTLNMYGPPDDPLWQENDPVIHAEGLRGLALYISSGNGLPGKYDEYGGPRTLPGPFGYVNQLTIGGTIEAATSYCSRNVQRRLNELGIPATYNLDNPGTHSWGYWQDAFKDSWPVLSGPLGI